LEGFERNNDIEELSLEENKIGRIENISHLRRLAKLDLGKNKISTIEGLNGCDSLSQLSLEDNTIRTLQGLERCQSLMELYIANNRIATLKELQYLRDLPRLLILDLSGNPVCQQPDYRLFAIFTLKRLKVLDGLAIDGMELNQARDQYSGRLTDEILTEVIGHNQFRNVDTLDLSSARLRTMDVLTAERFPALRVLVLDNK
jgi:hypothetical protein